LANDGTHPLFAERQPGPAESDINPSFVEMARALSAICATRVLLLIAVLTGSAIWLWTTFDPTRIGCSSPWRSQSCS